MSLNYLEINRIISELGITGHFFRSIKAISYDSFILNFYKKGTSTDILVAVDNLYRIHKSTIKYKKLQASHNLVEFIKKYLVDSVVMDIKQINNNRIIEINLNKSGNIFKLIIRLWGGFSNILITDENYKILHLHRKSTKKKEFPGEVFNIPPAKEVNKECKIEIPLNEDFSKYIEDKYNRDLNEILEEKKKQKLNRLISLKQKEIKKLEIKIEKYKDPETNKLIGDILTSNLYQIQKNLKEIILYDWEGKEIAIPLDPLKTPSENRDSYYKKYKQALNGKEHLEKRLNEAYKELMDLEDGNLAETVIKTPRSQHGDKIGLEYWYNGFQILVGRNAKENDQLLRRRVKGNDYWLHVRDYSGGYVFIKSVKGKTVPLDILIYAGNLALYYSKGKKNQKGDIYYTQVKYLKRVKNGKLGLVIPTRSKNIYIKMDKNIILHL